MGLWKTANLVLSLITGGAALVLVTAAPLFDQPDLNKPALIVAALGGAGVIFARRQVEAEARRAAPAAAPDDETGQPTGQ